MLKSPVIHYRPFQGGSSVVVFGVTVFVTFHLMCVYIISSPEPKAHAPASVVVVVVVVVVHHFQTSSPLKPLGQSKPNSMLSLLWKGERTFI